MVDIARDTESIVQWRDVQLAARLLMTPKVGPRTVARILLDMATSGALDDLLCFSASEFHGRWGVPPESARHFLRTADIPLDELSHAQAEDGAAWLLGFPGYPQKLERVLGNHAPPLLFGKGNPDILDRPAFMICGSRKASDFGIRVARTCSSMLAAEGVSVVSGHAGGVDIAAHASALESDGVTTIVLAEGISLFRPKSPIRHFFNPENVVVLSEFLPFAKWSPGNAMQRNVTLCGLADAVIAIEPSRSGGTFAAGKTALKFRRPLFVVSETKPGKEMAGSEMLLEEGACVLPCDDDGNPLLEELIACIEQDENRPCNAPANSKQATLFD